MPTFAFVTRESQYNRACADSPTNLDAAHASLYSRSEVREIPDGVRMSGTEGREHLGQVWIGRFLVKLIAVRGLRTMAACSVVVLAAAVGIGTQLHPMEASSATHSLSITSNGTSRGTSCEGQVTSPADKSTCFSGNDLLANSIARAVSIATRPTPTPLPKSQQTTNTYQAPNTAGQPCHDTYMFVPNITQWTTPPGCYATIFVPDRTQYSAPSTFGYCNWWVEALHPKQQDILYGSEYQRSTSPVVGAAMWFPPNVQGASSAGHWAQLVAISSDHYWLLITEMNFGWRGGGFGKVDYRYVHVDPAAGIVYVH